MPLQDEMSRKLVLRVFDECERLIMVVICVSVSLAIRQRVDWNSPLVHNGQPSDVHTLDYVIVSTASLEHPPKDPPNVYLKYTIV